MGIPELCLFLLYTCAIKMAAPAAVKVDYLYYTSPEGTGVDAGIYGGAVDFRDNGTIRTVIGHHCLEVHQQREDALSVQTVSFDEISGQFVLHIEEESERRLTLLRSPICATGESCFNSSENVIFHRIRTDHRVGPVAMFDSTIYFIYTMKSRDKDYEYSTIELRKLERKCELPAINPENYDVEDCSTLVATLMEDKYEKYPGYKPTANLLVIHNKQNKPIFFTQLQKLTYKNVKHIDICSMELIYVDHRGQKSTIDSQELNKNYFKYAIKHLGGLAYRNGKICWSMADTIKCAGWKRDRLINPRTIVYPGNASRVCEGGAGSEQMFGNLTTGVAISNAKNEIALYFGCMSESGIAGGAGLVRMPMNSQSASFYRLGNETNRVFGGSMFITDECAVLRQPEPVKSRVKGAATTWSPNQTWPLMMSLSVWTCLARLFCS